MHTLFVWGGWAMFIAAVAATVTAWRRTNLGRINRVRRPSIAVTIRKPFVQDDRWELRLDVTNVSIGGSAYSLRSTVIDARGMGAVDGGTTWAMAWQDGPRAHEVASGASAVLSVGAADEEAFYADIVDVDSGTTPRRVRAAWSEERSIALEIMVVDPDQDLAFHRVLIIEGPTRLDLPPSLRWA